MAKGRKRPASAIEEDPSTSAPPDNGISTYNAGGEGDGGSKALNNSSNEIKFGKHLASSDKRVRDRTVTALREWLRQRSRRGALSDLDLLKIWRGLWYCMFMCDKAPVQRELAENLAGLLNLFKDDRLEGVRFFKSFCVTMQRDWERIDNLRIDKYYTLVRLFVREALAFCRRPAEPALVSRHPPNKKSKGKKNSAAAAAAVDDEQAATVTAQVGNSAAVWDLGLLRAISDVMEGEVLTLHPAPIGLRLHLADVWAEEACNAGGEDMPTEAFLVALAPWLRAAAHPETNAVVFKRTFEGIFEGLLEHFPEEQGRGEDEVDEKKVFKAVELDKVQACLFEAAAAPQTRDKRRVKLYELHRKYQKRTGVAPDASAPPSGILPLQESSESESDEEDGEGDYSGEYVEAGARPRAVRGSEPAVVGWVAAGIAAGDISTEVGGGGGEGEGKEGGTQAKNRRKRSGETDEDGATKKKSKRSRDSIDKVDVEIGAPAEVEAPAAPDATSAQEGAIAAAVAPSTASAAAAQEGAVVTPSKKKNSKKRKKEEASPQNDVNSPATGGEGATADGDSASLASPPSSGKRKKKKKRRGSADGAGAEAALEGFATAVAPAAAEASVPRPPSSGKENKNKGKEPEEEKVALPDAGKAKTTPEDPTQDTATPDSSGSKKKKKRKQRPSLEGVASPTPPADTASTEVSAPSSGSFRTPSKKGSKKAAAGGSSAKKSPDPEESARKTVTFGANTEKDHVASVKDLKTRVITPAKDAGTPQKGLLKVGGGGSEIKPKKPAAGRKDTPYGSKKKRASDFF